jgi:predicted lipoprotein
MKKSLKYILFLLIIGLIAYNSVYFKKISELQAASKSFDATAYAQNLVGNKLQPVLTNAVKLDSLIKEVAISPSPIFKTSGHSLTIGSSKFFMVKGAGTVTSIDDSGVDLKTDGNNEIKIATEYIFGNGIRDASALVNLNDFTNTTDLSNISSEINKIIRKNVVPPFRSAVKIGDRISFAGAIELNQAHLDVKNIELLPVSLKIVH